MRASFLRRNEELDTICKKQETDLVIVANGTKGEKTSDFSRKFPLRLPGAAEIARGAYIDDQHHGELSLLRELLDVGGSHARGHVPIDRPNFVARLVLAHVFKVHPAPFKDTVVIAGEGGFDEAAGFDLQGADLLQNLGWCFASLGHHAA